MSSAEEKYVPRVGDSIGARRIVKSDTLHNMVIGPVIGVSSSSCVVWTNKGDAPLENAFVLQFSEWKFQFLHITSEE